MTCQAKWGIFSEEESILRRVELMANELYAANNLAEFMELLKAEHGDSNATLAAKISIGSTTIYRLLHGGAADDTTLDKIADYAGVTRDWLYKLAKGIPARPKYSRTVSMLFAVIEQAPDDIAETMLIQARALVASRKKKGAKGQ